MDYYKIGQRIREGRKIRGLSQERLAEEIGISTTHMSHIETGNTKLSLPVLASIASALNISADELLFGSTSVSHSTVQAEAAALLASCSPQQAKVLTDILRAAKISLEKYL